MDTKKVLADLISFKSYAKKEKSALKYVQNVLKENGIDSIFQDENLVSRLKGIDSTKAFILTGHIDVVDAGDVKKWKYNPFKAKIEGKKIYGRGSSDMKSGITAIMQTAINLKNNLSCDLYIAFVVGEETDGSGSVSFVNWLKKNGLNNYKKVVAIIGEPTELKNFQNGHRGNFFLKATMHGDAGHAARPDKIVVNVNKKLASFIQEIDNLSATWKTRFKKSEFPVPTIMSTSIESVSSSPNKTADTAVAKFDLRTIPNFHKKALQEVKKLAKARKIDIRISGANEE